MKAVKIKLREKKISGNRKSLYLDFYPAIPNADTGRETRREFLGLYIMERPKTELEKQVNRETKTLADNIRAQRQLAIQANNFGFFEQKKRGADFLAFFRACAEARNGSNKSNLDSAYKYLDEFTSGKCTMEEVTETFLEDFKEFLLGQELAINSCVAYYNKLTAAVK
jgi:Phage integrase SAM-like domain/Arm DNA-binding domain